MSTLMQLACGVGIIIWALTTGLLVAALYSQRRRKQ
jgi:hypothetical protein